MDKINQVIDMVEHPDRFSEAQVNEILQDEECRQTYLTMMEIRMAFDKNGVDENLDLDHEWETIKSKASQNSDTRQYVLEKSETRKPSLFSWHKMAASFAGVLLLSGVAFAAIHTFSSRNDEKKLALADTTTVQYAVNADTPTLQHQKKQKVIQKENFHKTFDNVALGNMLAEMAKYYVVEVEFRNSEAKQLRFYYDWDSEDELQKVLDELNHSQQVSLSFVNGAIVVE